MSGGKTSQDILPPVARRTLTGFSALRPGGDANSWQRQDVDQVVSILIDDQSDDDYFAAGFKIRAREAGLEKYLAPEIQRHFSVLFSAAFPKMSAEESRRALSAFLHSVPEVIPGEKAVISGLKVGYMRQLASTLRQSPKSKIAAAEQQAIDQVADTVENLQQQLSVDPENTPDSASEDISTILRQLRQAPGGRDRSIPRPPGPYAARDRLYEALEHGLYSAENILAFSPKSASAVNVVHHLSDCSVKLFGRDPQYQSLRVDNLVRSVPDPQEIGPYWDIFVSTCTAKSASS